MGRMLHGPLDGEDDGPVRSAYPMPGDSSKTCLDMAAIEVKESRKMKDDSKSHHILEEHLLKPRKKTTYRHVRHMVPSETNVQLANHKAKVHLRSLMQNHHSRSGKHKSRKSNKDSHKGHRSPRKNVSFVNKGAEFELDDLENPNYIGTVEVSKEDHINNGDIPSEKSSVNGDFRQKKEGSEDTVSDTGIVFYVPSPDNNETDPEMEKLLSAHSASPQPPTAIERELPWKRNTGREPMSASELCLLHNDESYPTIGEAPPWVCNKPGNMSPPPFSSVQSEPVLNIPEETYYTDDLNCAKSEVSIRTAMKNNINNEEISSDKINLDEVDCGPLPWRSMNGVLLETQKDLIILKDEAVPADTTALPWISNKEVAEIQKSGDHKANNTEKEEDQTYFPWEKLNGVIEIPSDNIDNENLPPLPWKIANGSNIKCNASESDVTHVSFNVEDVVKKKKVPTATLR